MRPTVLLKIPAPASGGYDMLVARVLAIVVMLIMAWPGGTPSHAQPSQQSLAATEQLWIDNINKTCRELHPDDEREYRECAVKRQDAMKAFFTKLYHYRDTRGIRSDEFEKGLSCLENASPAVREQGRKVAVERADWIKANDCYESALR